MINFTRQNEEPHTSREDESRADAWLPPSVLDAPTAREGMRQRWVRTSILGKPEPHHVARQMRSGWTPRPSDTVPKDFAVPTIAHGEFKGYVGVEDMILCEMPEEKAQARASYFKHKTGEQSQFTKNALAKTQASGGIPIEQSHDGSFTRGPGRVAAD